MKRTVYQPLVSDHEFFALDPVYAIGNVPVHTSSELWRNDVRARILTERASIKGEFGDMGDAQPTLGDISELLGDKRALCGRGGLWGLCWKFD